jgi:hypothetical protein
MSFFKTHLLPRFIAAAGCMPKAAMMAMPGAAFHPSGEGTLAGERAPRRRPRVRAMMAALPTDHDAA